MKNKKLSDQNIDPEYGIDSRFNLENVNDKEAVYLMEARLNRIKTLSKEHIKHAKLLQLRLKMEDFLANPVYDDQKYFIKFLEFYIDTIYSKRAGFASDIGISQVSLSHILNKYRNPKEDFLLKLMIHSELIYHGICDFQTNMWFRIYYLDKIGDTMSKEGNWRPNIEKQINFKENVEFLLNH